MTSEFTVIVGTLISAIVAGTISYVAGRGMKTHEWRLSLAKEEIASRRTLYVEFLAEAHRLLLISTEKKVSNVSELKNLNAKYVEISIFSSPLVVDTAKLIVDAILIANSRDEEKSDTGFYSRKEKFIDAVRQELKSFENTQ